VKAAKSQPTVLAYSVIAEGRAARNDLAALARSAIGAGAENPEATCLKTQSKNNPAQQGNFWGN